VLLKREPDIARLQQEVMAVKDEGGHSFCANKVWYVWFEPRLKQLVGNSAQSDDPILRSQESYELSYHTLYKLLPNCRNCICLPW
jgi:hypothetical protein